MPTALTTNGSFLEEAGTRINAKDRKAMLTMHGRRRNLLQNCAEDCPWILFETPRTADTLSSL